MKNKSQLIQHCEKALQEKWQYVFGAKGSVLSKEQIKEKQEKWGKSCVYDEDFSKAEKYVVIVVGLFHP